jgi:dienelactone hydrolase
MTYCTVRALLIRPCDSRPCVGFFWMLCFVVGLCEAGLVRRACGQDEGEGGFRVESYIDANGRQHAYVVFVPNVVESDDKLPVLMFLNGQNENGDDGVRQVSNNFGIQVWEMQEFFPFIAVAPQCRAGSEWTGSGDDANWAIEILDAVIREFDADNDRVYLTGVSSGGSGVWSMGTSYPDRFAALVPMCGLGGNVRTLVDARLPVWYFVNNDDAASLVRSSRARRHEMIQRGMSPLFTEFAASGHDCWNRALRMPALYRWLLGQQRSRNATERPFDYMPPPRLLSEWETPSGMWSYDDDDVVVGSASVEEGLLVSAHGTNALEIHADFWLAGESARDVVLLDDDTATSDESLRISLVLPDVGAGGIYRKDDGLWLAAMDPAAERSLRPNAWNEIRAKLDNGHLQVCLNGWPAADVQIGRPEFGPMPFRCGFIAPTNGTNVRWRYVRIRDLAGDLNRASE